MATLRNPSAEVLVGQIGMNIALFHKAEAKRLLALKKINKPSTFYWRGRGTARKAATVDAIPNQALAYPPATIAFLSGDGNNIAVEVASAVAGLFARRAPVKTGAYSRSLVYELNGKIMRMGTMISIAARNPLSAKEKVTVYPAVAYASSLEKTQFKKMGGIMYAVADTLISQYGNRASIKFTYIRSGQLVGLPFLYSIPVIVIGGKGEFPSTLKRPSSRRRKRKAV